MRLPDDKKCTFKKDTTYFKEEDLCMEIYDNIDFPQKYMKKNKEYPQVFI